MDQKRPTERSARKAGLTRRQALARLGLGLSIAYVAPALLTLSQPAHASDGGSGGASGGGGGPGGGSGDGGPGGGSGGSGGSGGGGSGSGGASPAPDVPADLPDVAPESGAAGSPFGGGVNQVGPDLSPTEEAEAIGSGWQ